MINGLYNIGVYWPNEVVKAVSQTLSVRYTIHATCHCKHKLKILHLSRGCYKAMLYGQVVECEVYNDKIVKIITRLPHKTRPVDLVAAILFEENQAIIKTMWINKCNDKHFTIRKENYVNGDN